MNWGRVRIRAPQDAAAGLFLTGLAIFALWQAWDLSLGTMRQLGPGMLPRVLAYVTGLCGLVILINAFLRPGVGLERWSLRAPFFVLGATVAFGLTIRPLGLSVAGPLVIILSGFASSETRLVESVIFAIVMTAFCIGLFKVMLSLPVPMAPWLLGY
jgi:putative tricarboxylic transport membrane protein